MAGNASITPDITTNRTALAETLERMIEHVQHNRDDDARALCKDIFSGNTDNAERLFKLTQLVLAGGGDAINTILSHIAEKKAEEEKEKKRTTERMIDQLARDIAATQARIAELEKEKADLEERQNEIDRRTQDIKQELTNLKDRKDVLEKYEIPEAAEAAHAAKETLENLAKTLKIDPATIEHFQALGKLSEQLVTVWDPSKEKEDPTNRKYIVERDGKNYVFVDEQGQKHTITDEKTLNEIKALESEGRKFGDRNNAASLKLMQEYEEHAKGLNDGLAKYPPEMREQIIKGSVNYAKALVELSEKNKELKATKEKIIDLETELKGLQREKEANAERIAKIEEELKNERIKLADQKEKFAKLSNESIKSSKETQEKYAKLNEPAFQKNLERLLNGEITLDEALSALPKDSRDIFKKTEVQAAIKSTQETFQKADEGVQKIQTATTVFEKALKNGDIPENRHQQILDKYGSDMSSAAKWVASHPSLAGTWGAKIIGALFDDANIVKAWKDPIKTSDGKDVYRENGSAGKFYTLDEKTQKRTEIKDPVELARIIKEYGVQGKLVANETPYGKDKNNSFDDTIEAELRTSGSIAAAKRATRLATADAETIKQDAQDRLEEFAEDMLNNGKPETLTKPAVAPKTTMPAARHEDAGQLSLGFKVASEQAAPMARPQPETPASTLAANTGAKT